MSGICGVIFFEDENSFKNCHLTAMVQALPFCDDGEGFQLMLPGGGLGAWGQLGQMSGTHELPLGTTGILAISFCGSIYNEKELFGEPDSPKNRLLAILELYRKEGMKFLRRLRGDFVVAIWDGREKALYLGTDPFRISPLFIYSDHNKLIFSSRIKGIISYPFEINKTVDPFSVIDVVGWSAIPSPRTIYQEIQKIPPGHYLVCQDAKMELKEYWDINYLNQDFSSERQLSRNLQEILSESIALRLGPDQESSSYGTFLSGGVDSSTVTGILSNCTRSPIKAFTIGFNEEKFSELNYAQIAVNSFGAKHYIKILSPKDVYDVLPILLNTFDEPFGNASAIPTFLCAKLAKSEGVEVLFAGDGGDELFAGNERYATQKIFDRYFLLPSLLRKGILEPLLNSFPPWMLSSFFSKCKRYFQRANVPYPERLTSYAFFNVHPISEFLNQDLLESIGDNYDVYSPVSRYYFKAQANNDLERQLYVDLKLAISDNDLLKVTRMTQAAGITVRFPMLDTKLAEFASTIPSNILMRGTNLRSFFKNSFCQLLPKEIRTKTKQGFGLPIPIWLKTDPTLNDMMHDLLLPKTAFCKQYFKEKAINGLIEDFQKDHTSFYGAILWNFMILELWFRENIPRL